MEAIGTTPEDYKDDFTCDVWPDNWPAVMVFNDLATQWRSGMEGRTGLDYSAIQTVLRLRGIPRAAWGDYFDSIQVMEEAALREMHV